jgi:peptide subunit release factor 1 (eRF1)
MQIPPVSSSSALARIEAEEVKGKKVHRVKVGGWSQARYQRHVNEDNIRHIILACEPAMVARLLEEFRARGLAIVGPHETLEALANGQVDELFISASLDQARPEREQVDAILAPEIPDSSGGTDTDEPREASLPDLLITKAKQTDAKISFIEDAGLLESVGGVGAFLRSRT